MKLITKPIKKGTVIEQKTSSKAAMLGTLVLSGVIALTATGCTAEVKLADGTPVGNVVINDSAIPTNVSINQQGTNADVIADPTVVLPDDDFDQNDEPVKSEETDAEKPSNTEPVTEETTAAPTATPAATEAPAETTPKATEEKKPGAIASVKNGSILKMRDGNDAVKYTYNEGWGYIFFYTLKSGRVWIQVEDHGFELPIRDTELGVCEAFLLKKEGQAYLYISAMHGADRCEINVYALDDDSVKYVGCYENLYTNEILSVDSFSCYEHYGRNYMFVMHGYYKVGNNGMPVLANNVHSLYNTAPSRIRAAYRGQVMRDGKLTGETTIINSGDVVKLVGTDLENYIDVALYNGTFIRLNCKNYFEKFSKSKNIVTDTIFCIFEYAKDFDEEKAGTIDAMGDGRGMVFQEISGRRELESAYGSFVVENNIDRQKIQITYNRHAYVLPVHTDNSGLTIGNTFLFKAHGKAFIYVTSCMDGDLRDMNIYEVSNSGIKYVGHHEGMYLMTGTTNPDELICHENDGGNGLMHITRYYKVSANGMPVIKDTVCFVNLVAEAKASKDLTGYVVKDGKVTNEEYTIKAGDRVNFSEFNEVTYMDITDETTGVTVRISSEPLLNEYYDQNDNHWVYKALLSFIEPV